MGDITDDEVDSQDDNKATSSNKSANNTTAPAVVSKKCALYTRTMCLFQPHCFYGYCLKFYLFCDVVLLLSDCVFVN